MRLAIVFLVAGCGRHAGLDQSAEWPDAPQRYSVAVMPADDPLNPCPRSLANVAPVVESYSGNGVISLSVSDPFLIHADDTWHLFYEMQNILAGHGDIGLAVSPDGRNWQSQGVVLDEPFNLSHPLVFESEGRFYMLPQSWHAGAVRLYRADPFPDNWTHCADLLDGVYVNPTVFKHAGHWWMFAGVRHGLDLHLFGSQNLESGWQEHPMSPVIRRDGHRASPAGRPFVDDHGRLIRLAQDVWAAGGSRVRAFEITELSATLYSERELSESPVLVPSMFPWSASGIHHLEARPAPGQAGQWMIAMAGHVPSVPDRPLAVGFRNGMALRGLGIHPAAAGPGDSLWLRFFWKGMAKSAPPPPACFVHFRHDGNLVFQADYQLVRGREVYEAIVEVPIDAPVGEYDIRLGLYYPDSGVRLTTHGKTWRARRSHTLPKAFAVVSDRAN